MSFEDPPRTARRAAWMRLRPGGAVLAPAIVGMAVALTAFAGLEAVLLAEGPYEPLWALLLFPAYGLLYVGAGLLAWTRRPSNRMGAVIVAGGFVWMVAGLLNTGIPALIAVGLIVSTVPLAIAVHLLHAFPSGRLRGRASRLTVLGGYFVAVVLQAPVYLVGQGAEGPNTVLQIANRHDLAHVGQWAQSIAGAAVMVATAAILFVRLRRAEPARRRVLAPLDAYGILAVLFVPIASIAVQNWFPEDGLELAVAQLTVMAGLPVAFVAAMLRGGFARTEEVQELGALLNAEEGRPALRAALRQVLGDDSLDLLFRIAAPPRWVDRDGVEVELSGRSSERSVSEVRIGGRLVGAIVYDATLIADDELVAEAARVTALALDNERLTVELLASREHLRVSRARLVEATDAERRRIARDLHDGLQTRLVLLAMEAGRAAAGDQTAAALSGGLQEAIVELRELVQGVVPAALTERGLYAAAVDLTDRMPIPVELDLEPLPGELPVGVETAGYFVVSEAFSNVVKHARAGELRLSISRPDGSLRIEVVDDGVGGAHLGGGLRGLADRIDALSGRLTVESPPGGGTRILAEVPCG
ncbi:MAG TPA: histidine kinase [Solirubrobacterales bacterium]|nr:histidine kinase [Solirubrobacterales bacterium]